MKKTTNWMLMALLVMGLSMNLASCKEDEMSDEEKAWHEADPYEKGSEEAIDFWTVISQLTDLQALPDNWKTATYEPTIGEASDTDPYTRIVVVQDAAEAVAAYSCLIGLAESLPDYTSGNNFSNNRVGTLNYARSRDGQSVATVEVNIKQMPSLKKIVYMTPEQVGENASLHGSAYYHFGDVISRVRPEDGVKEYWICVNPASHLTGKTTSHWISVSDLPAKNVYTWTRSDKEDVVLPTAICTQYTYIHDFATMLKAMLDPKQYFANIGQNGLTTFTGFSTKPSYINQYYFERINDAWQKKDLYSQVLYTTNDELKNRQELDIFCKGYSWVMGKTGTLYTYTYSGPNWKTATWKKRTYDFKDTSKVPFNIHYWGLTGEGSSSWEPRYAYVVRYTTGEALCKLAGTNYSWQTAISGCEDVYVYNKYWYDGNGYDMNAAPEILNENSYKPQSKPMNEVTKDDIGKIIGQDGRIYNNKQDAVTAGTTPMAMVADQYCTDYTFTEEVTISNNQRENLYGINKGIAIALEDGNLDQTKLKLRDDKVTVDKYDPTWYNSHKVEGATWYVPNIYHWQRLLLPHGCTEFWLMTYFRENFERLNETYDTWRPGGLKFLETLDKAGVEIETDRDAGNEYLMAGGVTADEKHAYSTSISRGRSDNYCIEFGYGTANRCRYVLTW